MTDDAQVIAFPGRCQGTRPDGRGCRNHAQASGLCQVHDTAPPLAPDATPGSRGGPTVSPASPLATDEEATPLAEALVRGLAGLRTAAARTLGVAESEVGDTVEELRALLRRRLVGDYEVDVYGFDRELTEQVLLPLFRPLYRSWWRVTTSGLGNVPADSGALLVGNHAGVLPFDAIMTKVALLDAHPARRHLRELAADLALKLPVVGPLARKTGNTLAHPEDAQRLLRGGELVGVWPEGFKGIGKPYRDRYKLQRFGRGGFVEVALRTGTPLIPVATIGAEEIYPMVADLKPLARLLGLPYLPVTWTFPLLGPLGLVPLPSKWTIEFGAPIETADYGPDGADDPMLVFQLTEHVRDVIQQMLYRNLVGRRSIFF